MNDKIKYLEESGAAFLGPANRRALELANAAFQGMKAAVLPAALAEFYMSFGGAVLGDAFVFPLDNADRPARRYAVPGMVKVNRDLSHMAALRGKTVWGKNQLYIFSSDTLGGLYMHDVLMLQVLRKYADLAQALTDCLLVGKI